MEKKLITREGYERLKKELERLKKEELPSIARELEIARSYGDLSENAEYKYARERQEQVMAKIAQLENHLSMAEIVDVHEIKEDKVCFGAWVKVEDLKDGTEGFYRIVGEMETDLKKGFISYASPFGRALMGRRKGETVVFNTPSGERVIKIVDVKPNGPERNQDK